ncbi:MAG: AAA family ATPase, partial [Planctomycetota bacterium]
MDFEQAGALLGRVEAEVAKVVIGQPRALREALLALVAGGHALLEGVPGTAKTLLVRILAKVLGCRFARIQFTPDLMPADVTGVGIPDGVAGGFTFRRGPIFTDLLLADEINRSPAKTQAALLEAMQERQVTADGVRHPIGDLFTVFATQN